MKNRPRLRRARPLLIAGAAVTAIAATIGCPGPFGNLRVPPPPDGGTPDMAATDGFFGNLRAPDMGKPDTD